MITPGKYKHYKGKEYIVEAVATHSETLESLVIYSTVGTGKKWIRPLAAFLETVMVDGEMVSRFKKV